MYTQETPAYAYWTRIPNLYDDSDLDPYQMRLLVHIARRGVCWESDRALARHCRMSLGQVNKTRHWLAKAGWIEPPPTPEQAGRACGWSRNGTKTQPGMLMCSPTGTPKVGMLAILQSKMIQLNPIRVKIHRMNRIQRRGILMNFLLTN